MKRADVLSRVVHVNNGWDPAIYIIHISQNFCLFHAPNLSVLNFRVFQLMYPGSVSRSSGAMSGRAGGAGGGRAGGGGERSVCTVGVWLPQLPVGDEASVANCGLSSSRPQMWRSEPAILDTGHITLLKEQGE